MSDFSPSGRPTRLARAASPYLRSAAHQPVEWYPWGEEAFSRAKAENKPVLLDIGAVWCHWCHVMDGESYENDAIAKSINDDFIAVKVDRDERPDVDARYQRAVQAMTGQGGWPLTVFLTPAGIPFYGGTYFPPEQRYGRAGFPQVLRTVAHAYATNREQVEQQSSSLANYLRSGTANGVPESKTLDKADVLTEKTLSDVTAAIVATFDVAHGGFGSAPKFPHPSAIDFLLARAARTANGEALHAVAATLTSMGNGGVYDQLGGGFHRYSTDERWIVPHFEKMLYDNTELLRNYAHAYAITQDPFYREIGEGIIGWLDHELTDRERGGFFGSQDADLTFGDDGSFFTWTMKDAQEVLSTEEFVVAQPRYNIFAEGEMHIDKTQNVLFVDRSLRSIADELNESPERVASLLDAAKSKLREARARRSAPYIDQTIYVGWNAMGVTAYLDADAIFGRSECRTFALRTLDRLLSEAFTPAGNLRHTLAPDAPTEFLDDYASMIAALFRAHDVTGSGHYLTHASELVRRAVELFLDREGGGFFDRVPTPGDSGILDMPHKPLQDSPSPSANAVMCRNLLVASEWIEDPEFRSIAENTLRRFLPEAGSSGLFMAELFRAADDIVHSRTHVVIVGVEGNAECDAMMSVAGKALGFGAIVTRVVPADGGNLPIAMRAMAQSAGPAAYLCSGTQCEPPCTTANELRIQIEQHIHVPATT